jgi:gamma-glutamylcyclotransferase (GGCT)/AIG2-like uncharacterized protein YtfP
LDKAARVLASAAVSRVLYFAYGSNMDTATLGGRRGVAWTRAGAAFLDGWRIAFDKPSMLGTGEGMATILRDAASSLWGVVYDISTEDLDHLELTEGVRIGHYERVEVPVRTSDGWPGAAIETAVTLASDHRDSSIRPTTRYRDILVRGASEHGLPAAWVDVLRRIDAVEEKPEHAAMRPVFDLAMKTRT